MNFYTKSIDDIQEIISEQPNDNFLVVLQDNRVSPHGGPHRIYKKNGKGFLEFPSPIYTDEMYEKYFLRTIHPEIASELPDGCELVFDHETSSVILKYYGLYLYKNYDPTEVHNSFFKAGFDYEPTEKNEQGEYIIEVENPLKKGQEYVQKIAKDFEDIIKNIDDIQMNKFTHYRNLLEKNIRERHKIFKEYTDIGLNLSAVPPEKQTYLEKMHIETCNHFIDIITLDHFKKSLDSQQRQGTIDFLIEEIRKTKEEKGYVGRSNMLVQYIKKINLHINYLR